MFPTCTMMKDPAEHIHASRPERSSSISTYRCSLKLYLWILSSAVVLFLLLFHRLHRSSPSQFLQTPNSFDYSITITSSPPSVTKPSEVVVEMTDRTPSYKLATKSGGKPYADGDRAQAKVIEELHLYERCQQDPSTIVVDVGAFLGDFGLYAAACGCTVYIFEIQPDMVALINSSISHNSFSRSRVHLFHNAVSDLRTGSTVRFSPDGGSTAATEGPFSVQTIRLDDVSWSSPSIYLLKIDVEGFEFNVFRSATNLFAQKRIRHVIFEYTAWFTDRAPQELLLPYVQNELRAKFLYALHRTANVIYGPLRAHELRMFYKRHLKAHLQTDIYTSFDDTATSTSIKAEPYRRSRSSA